MSICFGIFPGLDVLMIGLGEIQTEIEVLQDLEPPPKLQRNCSDAFGEILRAVWKKLVSQPLPTRPLKVECHAGK